MQNTQTRIEHLMRINVGDNRIREKGNLLLVGSCVMSRYKELVDEFSLKHGGQYALQVCLEETHVNQAGFKIGSIVRYSNVKKITVLTVDGSPHCVQLHYVVEDIKRHFTPEIAIEHFVIEKGEVLEVSAKAVKKSRHLSKIEKMLMG
ncbi:4Fe-4S ferredoxin [Candidatus Thorarchaeota archaeon]|nr:MAG: 4Fe-4S ferredoxin [Candidatus Thorarchaeota archaeon]